MWLTHGGYISVCRSPSYDSFSYLSVYFYVDVISTVNPVLHNAIDRSSSARDGFAAMMFIFGSFLSCVNSVACYAYITWSCEYSSYRMSKFQKTMRWLGIMFVAFPFWCCMIIMPFFGGWIVTPIVQKVCFPLYMREISRLRCVVAYLEPRLRLICHVRHS